MSERARPPFRADHVGSLIRPPAVIEAREQWLRGALDAARLQSIQRTAIRDVVRRQEELGLRGITDGEYNRGSWHTDFLTRFANVVEAPSRVATTFRSDKGTTRARPHMVQVTGKLARPSPIFVEDFRFLRSLARGTPKITIPSPSLMHFRGGREAISADAYPDMASFYDDLARVYREEIADLAAAGCRYLQLDEVNLAYLCDPALSAQAQARLGETPDRLVRTYARLINEAIRARPADMVVCMHLCRGNFAGNWVAEGGYEPVAEALFSEIAVDGYFMEYDTARAGGFEPLRLLPAGKTVVLGLLTTKTGALEAKELLRRRIDAAAAFVPLEQLCLSPQCGFASGIAGGAMTIEEQWRKLARVVETAREVWGD